MEQQRQGSTLEIQEVCHLLRELCNSSTAIHQVVQEIWESETVPDDWSEAVIIPFFKKGDKRQCFNYRGISLMNIAAKVNATLWL